MISEQLSLGIVLGELSIRESAPKDLPYLRWLTKQESYALGWIPEQIYERVWSGSFTGWLPIAEVNGWPAGFCFAAPGYQPPYIGRIYQLAVQRDARRHEYASRLVEYVTTRAGTGLTNGFSLRCACELPSNSFWEALGFDVVSVVNEGASVGDSPRKVRRPLFRRLRMHRKGLL